jgi:hypothetical protein
LSEIHCGIDNCHYWGQGNICEAKEILVASDAWAAQTPDNIDAPNHAQVPQMKAGSCMETCCKTFVNKQAMVKVDGVTKV